MKLTQKALYDLAKKHKVNGLLSAPEANIKTAKNGKIDNILTAPLHLLPSDLSGHEVCFWKTPLCEKGCLHTSGNPAYLDAKTEARKNRTKMLFANKDLFKQILILEIVKHSIKALDSGMSSGVRPNATSDIPWENESIHISVPFADFLNSIISKSGKVEIMEALAIFPGSYKNIFEVFPIVKFYDYTAGVRRLFKLADQSIPNYHLTFSGKENNSSDCLKALALGFNVAMPFAVSNRKKGPLPTSHKIEGQSFPVLDGDLSDYRPNDSTGHIVGLRAKGVLENNPEYADWVATPVY